MKNVSACVLAGAVLTLAHCQELNNRPIIGECGHVSRARVTCPVSRVTCHVSRAVSRHPLPADLPRAGRGAAAGPQLHHLRGRELRQVGGGGRGPRRAHRRQQLRRGRGPRVL